MTNALVTGFKSQVKYSTGCFEGVASRGPPLSAGAHLISYATSGHSPVRALISSNSIATRQTGLHKTPPRWLCFARHFLSEGGLPLTSLALETGTSGARVTSQLH